MSSADDPSVSTQPIRSQERARRNLLLAAGLWAAVTIGWLASIGVGAAGDPPRDCDRVRTPSVIVRSDWRWLPPGHACTYAANEGIGSFDGSQAVLIEPNWTPVVLIGLGWTVIALVSAADRCGAGSST